MDENTLTGTADRIGGLVKSTAESFVGDTKTELAGKAQEANGIAQQEFGKTADAVREATSSAPITSLLTAAGIGLVVGLYLNRR